MEYWCRWILEGGGGGILYITKKITHVKQPLSLLFSIGHKEHDFIPYIIYIPPIVYTD